MVVLEHVDDCRPQQFKVSLRESGRLAGEICGNIAFRTVQTVRHDVLAAHFGALFLRVSLGGDGNTGDRDFLRNNRIHTAGKAKLHRTAHLSAVECTLDKGGHNRTECANIVEILAHKVAQLAVQLVVLLLCILELVRRYTDISAGFCIAAVERYTVLDVNAVAGFAFLGHFHIVADFALEAYIGHQTVAGFRVDTRHVARIRIAVRIAVFHVEKDYKFIAVFDGFHLLVLLFSVTLLRLMVVTEVK
jgi:hypothetical protein